MLNVVSGKVIAQTLEKMLEKIRLFNNFEKIPQPLVEEIDLLSKSDEYYSIDAIRATFPELYWALLNVPQIKIKVFESKYFKNMGKQFHDYSNKIIAEFESQGDVCPADLDRISDQEVVNVKICDMVGRTFTIECTSDFNNTKIGDYIKFTPYTGETISGKVSDIDKTIDDFGEPLMRIYISK